jgi:hypothetical protein
MNAFVYLFVKNSQERKHLIIADSPEQATKIAVRYTRKIEFHSCALIEILGKVDTDVYCLPVER